MAQFEKLPPHIQRRAELLFELFEEDPSDPLLGNEELYDTKKGRHRKRSHSVNITGQYRAIYVVDRGKDGTGPLQYCWYWIGNHNDYSNFTGKK
jgi:hypothetical protein